jgi:hypothetical protein
VVQAASTANDAASSAGSGRRHNAALRSRSPGKNRMWVVYLNIVIAVLIVALFIVWTFRGRK